MERIDRDNYRIVDFRALGGARIQLKYINGVWVENDLSDLVALGGICAQLADDAYLAQARIGDYGFWIEWPGDVDVGADTLWEDGVPVDCPPDEDNSNGYAPVSPADAEPVAAK